jgi:hypothetical protein
MVVRIAGGDGSIQEASSSISGKKYIFKRRKVDALGLRGVLFLPLQGRVAGLSPSPLL